MQMTSEQESQELQNKINLLEVEISRRKKIIGDEMIKLLSKKCEYCGISDGIHKNDCLFIKRYC